MKLDIVVPFFNEEACACQVLRQLRLALAEHPGWSARIVAVDDGSTDQTAERLVALAKEDANLNVIRLLGNHGHQRALVAGLDQCDGDMILMMDGDGQHPLDVAMEMVGRLEAHPETMVVQGVRTGRQEGLLKCALSRAFYGLMRRLMPEAPIEAGASDFRVIRREVLEVIALFTDRHRNLRLLFASLRLPTALVGYKVAPRVAGRSKYTMRKMVRLGVDGLFAFSTLPLRVSLVLMTASAGLGLGYLIYGVHEYLERHVVSGWTSLIALAALLSSAVFGILAILCEYVIRIYEEVRGHPVYLVRSAVPPVGRARATESKS